MLQIAFLLAGAPIVRKTAPLLMILSILWGGPGLSVFLDGLQGVRHFPLHVFGIILLADSLISLMSGSLSAGTRRNIFFFKSGLFFMISMLILSGRHSGNLVLAVVSGLAFFVTGLFTIASAVVVRFKTWRRALFSGLSQIAFAVFLFLPFPTSHDGTVSQFIGMVLLTSGIQGIRLSLRMKRIRNEHSVFDMLVPYAIETDSVVPSVNNRIVEAG
jgi:uncharacterized membrane protein HdeD (DUF308 family)